MFTTAEIDDRIEKCQKILGEDPSSQIFAALAEALRKKGDLDKAFRICQNGLRLHPKYGSAHLVMAKINLDRGLYDWAEIEVKKAAELDGRTRSVELLLAEIYVYKGEFSSAVKLLNRLHEADPHNAQISKLLDIAQKIPEEQRRPVSGADGRPKVMSQKLSAGSVAPQDQTPTAPDVDEKERLGPKDILLRSVTIPGVAGAMFTNLEGLVVDSEWTLTLDQSVCGAVVAEVGNQLEKDLIQNSFGHVRTVLIETHASTFYLVRVKEGVFVFVANASANLGSLRMRIEKLLERFHQ